MLRTAPGITGVNMFARLGIGTVQFGQVYGLNNAGRRTPEAEVRRILERATAAGCFTIDTAAAYGDAEEVLGRVLVPELPYQIVTKTLPLGGRKVDTALETRFRDGFLTSLQRLGRPSVYGLLVHHPEDLLAEGGERLFRVMKSFQHDGLVERIGVSIYDRAQLNAILDRFDIGLVQLPFSILDQRLLEDGTLGLLRSQGIEIHARSAFMQGLLLMPRECTPPYFAPILSQLRAWDERVVSSGLAPAVAALAFVLSEGQVDRVIVGFDSFAQFNDLLFHDLAPLPFCTKDIACADPAFVNPGNWRLE